MDLVPYLAIAEIAKVLGWSATVKFKPWDWIKRPNWSEHIGAAERHLGKWKSGVDIDEQSGLSHLAHAGCRILFLLTFEICGLGKDDRFKLPTSSRRR